jgi:hypothetical protein
MRLLEYGGQLVFADWAHFQGGDVQKEAPTFLVSGQWTCES